MRSFRRSLSRIGLILLPTLLGTGAWAMGGEADPSGAGDFRTLSVDEITGSAGPSQSDDLGARTVALRAGSAGPSDPGAFVVRVVEVPGNEIGGPGAVAGPGEPARTGSIRGRVVIAERPQRRVAERYPTQARGSAREAPPVPAVVHLEGPGLPRASAGPADRVRMAQRDTTFIPGAAVVPVGTSVAFPNEDPFFHNVFSYSRAKRFDLGRFPQGESKSVVFDEPGYVKVFCEVHQWMRAGVLVVASPFHRVVADDGTFHLDDVPAGRHTLVVTDFDRGTRELELNVPEGGEIQVRVEFGR